MVTFQAYKWEVEDSDDNTTIYIYGLTAKGERVIVKVPDFKPYVYVELDSNVKWSESKINLLRTFLKKALHENYPVKNKLVTRKKNYYYRPAKFLWMAFNNKAGIKHLERLLNKRFTLFGVGNVQLKVHEQAASQILQLFAMRKVTPSGWIVANQTKKKSIIEEYGGTFSCADIEVLASHNDISPAKGIDGIINPLVLSYDIECVSGDSTGNTFPNPKRKTDEVICISATVAYIEDEESVWKTYSLVSEGHGKACPDLQDGAELRRFKDEKALLLGWSDFIKEIDPDVITGYNSLSFDDRYLFERASAKLCWPKFSVLGRIIGQRSKTDERKWSSSAYGDQVFQYIDIPGRVHIDMYPAIFKEFTNLPSYTLDYVSEHFLGDHKIDLPPDEMIRKWHRGTPDDIRDIVTYCNKDTFLPLKLMQKLNTWIGLAEMANVVKVPAFDLITRGQQICVYSQVYILAYEIGVVCTNRWSDYQASDAVKQFVGATVQNPKTGYWEIVPTYDFKSLYPTTIIAYNICFSTFITADEDPEPGTFHDLEWEEHSGCEHDTAVRKTKVTKVICGKHHYRFWKAEIKKGMLPTLLENTLDARSNTREQQGVIIKKLKEEYDELSEKERKKLELMIKVLEQRQLKYKVSANSMYGGLGSDYSYTPFYEGAASTTAMGRKSIQDAIDFTVNYRKDTIVVYGDSVTGDTPILLKNPSGNMIIDKIQNICQDIDWQEYQNFKMSYTEPINSAIEYHVIEDGVQNLLAARHLINGNKRWSKECKFINDWMVWTDNGWSKIKKVIRHKTAKKIYRVTTHSGSVDVTQDHSLLTSDKELVKPIDLDLGDELLHSYPYPGNRNIKFEITGDKETIADIWFHKKLVGQKCYISSKNNSFTIYNDGYDRNSSEVNNIEQLGTCNDYVYDIETECGRFQAGIGEMIVKNTDSAMFHFSSIKTLEECFEVCEELEKKINDIFPKPMYLELEKIYSKYFLLTKKRYVGYIVDKKGNLIEVDKKGVVIKRRDNCGYLKEVYSHLIDMVMAKEPRWRMYEYLQEKIDDLLVGNVTLEKLVISKSIKDTYKAKNLPHVNVAEKMRSRGKYVATGTRIRYIFVETEGKNDPQYVKAEDPDYYLKNKDTVKIDYLYYLEKQLVNPIDEVFEVKFNRKCVLKNLLKLIKKGEVRTAREYFQPKFKII